MVFVQFLLVSVFILGFFYIMWVIFVRGKIYVIQNRYYNTNTTFCKGTQSVSINICNMHPAMLTNLTNLTMLTKTKDIFCMYVVVVVTHN